MAVRCEDLPDECWELIFDRLGHHSHFEAPSLVCNRFLAISNRLRTSLSIVTPTILIHGTLSKLFRRFPNLKSLDLREFCGEFDVVAREIARSGLRIETVDFSKQKYLDLKGLEILGSSMRSLKVLKCAELAKFCDTDLITIANSMPCLEELDFSSPRNSVNQGSMSMPSGLSEVCVTDNGIKQLSSKLVNLRKINISGNFLISDESLVALSSTCVLLNKIVAMNCTFITTKGIRFVLSHSLHLCSISVNNNLFPERFSPFEDSLFLVRALHTLNFFYSIISDDFLHSIVKARLPLRKLTLSGCRNFSFSGLSLLLYTYQSLEYLALDRINLLTDQIISDLSQYLHNLVTIKLNYCWKLTNSTFFTLAKNCYVLENIEMGNTRLGRVDCAEHFVKNPRIKSVNLSSNPLLNDDLVKIIASMCPKLELLDVRACSGITEGGLVEVLTICSDIKHLNIDDCVCIKSIGTGSEFWKLETLRAARSGINDEGLEMVGRICPGLVNLDMEGCVRMTKKGVMEVVRNCKRLRVINLKMCRNVDVGIVDSMVFRSPSLRKIVSPQFSRHTEPQKMLFMRHGCQVSERELVEPVTIDRFSADSTGAVHM